MCAFSSGSVTPDGSRNTARRSSRIDFVLERTVSKPITATSYSIRRSEAAIDIVQVENQSKLFLNLTLISEIFEATHELHLVGIVGVSVRVHVEQVLWVVACGGSGT